MAKWGTSKVVPRLRFPEFLKDTWDRIPGDKLFDLINNRDAEAGLPILAITQEHGAIPRDLIDYHVSVTEKSIESYKVVERGDFIISLRSFQGGIEFSNYRGICSPAYVILRRKGDGSDQYFSHLFKTDRFIQQLTRNIEGLRDGKMISYKQFSEQLIPTPKPSEQQKIADCLTSLDEVIAAQGRKVEALKAHKRGLMQQLFPREGETRPRLRFPEFHNAPEWITRPLGELMVIGSSRRVHESDWTTAGVPFYRAREIVAIGKGEPINPLFISEALYREFAGSTGEIEEGQLLVTGVGSIGIPYLVKFGDRFYFKDGNIIWLKNNQADLAGNFLLRLFESDYVQGQIATMAGIGTVGTYTIENAKRTVAIFPVDKCEQQRIADCLSSLDTQIAGESSQLAALKTHKQGLMQQLFPSLEGAK